MDPPFDGLQEKSPLSGLYLIVSLLKLMHLLLVSSTYYLITGDFEFKNIGNR